MLPILNAGCEDINFEIIEEHFSYNTVFVSRNQICTSSSNTAPTQHNNIQHITTQHINVTVHHSTVWII